MKVAGFLLLLAGWGIVLAALLLLAAAAVQTAFILAGTGVEGLGMAMAIRSHINLRRERRLR